MTDSLEGRVRQAQRRLTEAEAAQAELERALRLARAERDALSTPVRRRAGAGTPFLLAGVGLLALGLLGAWYGASFQPGETRQGTSSPQLQTWAWDASVTSSESEAHPEGQDCEIVLREHPGDRWTVTTWCGTDPRIALQTARIGQGCVRIPHLRCEGAETIDVATDRARLRDNRGRPVDLHIGTGHGAFATPR